MTGIPTPTASAPRATQLRAAWPWWLLLLPLLAYPIVAFEGDDPVALEPLPLCATEESEQSEPARPHVTILVLDVSSSVIDQGGADPKGRSFDEARLLARTLAATPCTPDDRMGVVIFASSAVEVPATLLTSMSVLETSIARPPQHELGAGTNMIEALRRVDEMARRYPGHEVTVILLSDMQVTDDGAVASRLSELSEHSRHLVALGDHSTRFDRAFDTVSRLDDVHSGAVAQALADAVALSRKEQR